VFGKNNLECDLWFFWSDLIWENIILIQYFNGLIQSIFWVIGIFKVWFDLSNTVTNSASLLNKQLSSGHITYVRGGSWLLCDRPLEQVCYFHQRSHKFRCKSTKRGKYLNFVEGFTSAVIKKVEVTFDTPTSCVRLDVEKFTCQQPVLDSKSRPRLIYATVTH